MLVHGPCPLCSDSRRAGLLWLGGDDWVECPNRCENGVLTIHEQRFDPIQRTISIAGIGTVSVPRHHPIFEKTMGVRP